MRSIQVASRLPYTVPAYASRALPAETEPGIWQSPRRLPAASLYGTVTRHLNSGLVSPLVRLGAGIMGLALRKGGFDTYDVNSCVGPLRVWDAPGTGLGPPVVVLHGLGGSAEFYSPLLQALLPHTRRVVAVNLPNHGASAAMGRHGRHAAGQVHACKERAVCAVNQVLAAMLPEPAVLLGHSLGGYFAMRCALQAKVAGIILVSPDGAPFHSDDLAALRRSFAVQTEADADDVARRTWPHKPRKAKLYRRFIWAQFARPEVQYVVHSDLLQPWLAPAQLALLPRNTCLMVGRHEAFLPAYAVDYLRRHLPAGHSFVQTDTGHGDITDGPVQLMEPIAAYLRRPSPPRQPA